MPTYCIFEVFDYKGGELVYNVNLSYSSFIVKLSNKFESIYYNFYNKSIKRDIKIGSVIYSEYQIQENN